MIEKCKIQMLLVYYNKIYSPNKCHISGMIFVCAHIEGQWFMVKNCL